MQKQAVVLSFVLVISLFMMLLVVIYSIETQKMNIQEQLYLEREESVITAAEYSFTNQFFMIMTDVSYVADELEKLCLDKEDISIGLLSEYMENKPIYDQIRLIGIDGKETYRINRGDTGPEIVEKDKLQDKSDTYYFKEGIGIGDNKIYISKLDLNVENGEVETPHKPMLRFVEPLYNDGEVFGVVVFNYNASILLESVKTFIGNSLASSVYMVNEEGYWLINSDDPNQEWGFMFDEKKDMRFNLNHPEIWNYMMKNDRGYYKNSQGIYMFDILIHSEQIQMPIQGISMEDVLFHEGHLRIVTLLQEEDKGFGKWHSFIEFLIYHLANNTALSILYIVIVISSGILVYWYMDNKIKFEMISKYDLMTKAYNRNYGLKIAENEFHELKKMKLSVGLIYIDINHLKKVNDQYGHKCGDKLIRLTADAIVKEIRWHHKIFIAEWMERKINIIAAAIKGKRNNDIFIRLGGDEFFLMFSDVDEAQLQSIWKRIKGSIEANFIKEHKITVSHGLQVVQLDGTESLAHLMDETDTLMYIEKKEKGNNRR